MPFFESAKTKQLVALAGIVILTLFLFYSLANFIPSFLGALILFIVLSPLMNFLHVKKKFNKNFSTIIIILFSILIIIVPSFILGDILIGKLRMMLSGNTLVTDQLHHANLYLKQHTGIVVFSPDNIAKIQTKLTSIFPDVLNQIFSIILSMAIMYFMLYFMLFHWRSITDMIIYYSPYKKENSELFAKELISQTYSNVLGAPLLATIQGIFAIIGFSVFGLNEPFFWGIMCGFLSFFPFVGSALIWVPAGIIQLSMAEHWQGVGILIYGAVVITNIDNVFRFIIQKKIANVHPLVTVFGVIVGLNWFGLPGLVFGPILISYLLIMIKIYRIEYANKVL